MKVYTCPRCGFRFITYTDDVTHLMDSTFQCVYYDCSLCKQKTIVMTTEGRGRGAKVNENI
jgi:predicted RNA-binding Zn-ribbon protein involved in translation (DUF1610 family)